MSSPILECVLMVPGGHRDPGSDRWSEAAVKRAPGREEARAMRGREDEKEKEKEEEEWENKESRCRSAVAVMGIKRNREVGDHGRE